MGNNINFEKINKNIPILIWIDKKVKNNENKKYMNYIKKNFKFQSFCFETVNKSYENLKKLEFIQTYIICSGKSYIELIDYFKKNINEFMISPKVIIFTSNKKKFYEINAENKDLSLDDPFYNWGGVTDKFSGIVKFLKMKKCTILLILY